ncbi:MAG: pyridoxamine 5'-phosphate oxidase family protein [Bdellovibrionaceae bacterium]|nr:pyridoxamine 5'-phosphate oxidase family protein [Pseudobdellovibrionaceae bacterium]
MKTEIHRNTVEENIKRLGERIQDADAAMFTTVDPDGALRSRPMASLKTPFNGELWFFTHRRAGKSESIQNDKHVNVAYVDPKRQTYVSISGRADLVEDAEKRGQLWTPELGTWFPEGLQDPDLSLIRVRVESAEYWDSPATTFVHLVGFNPEKPNEARPSTGSNERLEFPPATH